MSQRARIPAWFVFLWLLFALLLGVLFGIWQGVL
jgi:hypothetical protein